MMMVVLSSVMIIFDGRNVASSGAEGETDEPLRDTSGDTTDEEISVWFMVSRGRNMLLAPTLVTVTNFDFADYGFGHVIPMVRGITGAHIWFKAHADEFGLDAMTRTLTVRSDGWLERFWNYDDGKDGYFITYQVNGHLTSKCASNFNIYDGDIFSMNFIGGSEPAYRNYFTPSTQTVITGAEFTVALAGDSTDPAVSKDNAPMYIYNEGGDDEYIGLTDKYGRLSHTFNEPGTYWLYTVKDMTAYTWAQVIVRDVLAESVTISETSANLFVDSTMNLSAIVYPTDADVTSVQWSSSQKSVATITDDGTVKGLSPGRTVITAKTTDGNYIATCEVTVRYDRSGSGTGNEGTGQTLLYVGIGAISAVAVAIIAVYYTRRG